VIEFQNIIAKELNEFDKKFKIILSTKASLLYKVTSYISKNSGKKIRPICTILASGLINNINEKTYRSSILIELLHTATLIHDDIVDDANIRRSKFSINAIWKNKISVLSGDYFLAKGLKLAVQNKDFDVLDAISTVVQKIVEGELMQIEKTKKLNLTEEDYFKIIKLKTGSLFECAFHVGGLKHDGNPDDIQNLIELGSIIGLLFQIKDDILDYNFSNHSGKQYGNDIQEGKINLPLLYSLRDMNFLEKNSTFRILRKKNNSVEELNQVCKLVEKYQGLEKAEHIIENHYKKAVLILKNFNNSKYKNATLELLNFLIKRKK
tara:strand:- start:15408 stop:16373 length:966 start_codon:yes stop_codon:yes gene_type:complete